MLSYDDGTYVTCPRITGAVVDLETMTLLTMEELLQIQGQTAASAEEKIREMLVAVSDNGHPVWIKEITDAYMDENGDLIVVASTEVPRGDQPDNAALHYNLNRESVSVWATSQNLEDFTASFRSMPEDYVFDQAAYDAYYSEDHIPETMLVYHDDPRVEPEIVELPGVEPEQ